MKPWVAFKTIATGTYERTYVTVLVGSKLGVYEKDNVSSEEAASLKRDLDAMSGRSEEWLDGKVEDVLYERGWKFSTKGWNEHADSKLRTAQLLAKKRKVATTKKELRPRVRDAVLEAVTQGYERWRVSGLRKEPCYTATLLREIGIPLTRGDHVRAFQELPKREQTAMIRSALMSLYRNGKLARSTGQGLTGRDTHCYEPPGTSHVKGDNPKVRSTFEVNGITFRLSRVSSLGREGGKVKGWNVYGPDGSLLVDWAPTVDAAKSSVRQNLQHFGKAWAHKRGDNPKTVSGKATLHALERAPRVFNPGVKSWEVYGPEGSLRGYLGRDEEGWSAHALPKWGNLTVGYSSKKKALAAFGFEGAATAHKRGDNPSIVKTVKKKLREHKTKKAVKATKVALARERFYWEVRAMYGSVRGGAVNYIPLLHELRELGVSEREIDRIETRAKTDAAKDRHERGENPKTKPAIERLRDPAYLREVESSKRFLRGETEKVPTAYEQEVASSHRAARHMRGDNPRAKGSDIVPEMAEAQSRARVKKLRAQGYTVRKVEVPGVGTVVMKSKKKRGKKKARRKSTLRKSESSADVKLKARMRSLIGR
jgi:hypothetical protein